MFHYDALRQSTHEHRLHHEAEAEAERLALQAREGRAVAGGIEQRRAARRDARQWAAHIVVTVLPRR